MPRIHLGRSKFTIEVGSRIEALPLSHMTGEAQTLPKIWILSWWSSPTPGCWGQEPLRPLTGLLGHCNGPMGVGGHCLELSILTSSNPPAGPDLQSLPPSRTVTDRGHRVHTSVRCFLQSYLPASNVSVTDTAVVKEVSVITSTTEAG